jgi:hypothetical protein
MRAAGAGAATDNSFQLYSASNYVLLINNSKIIINKLEVIAFI